MKLEVIKKTFIPQTKRHDVWVSGKKKQPLKNKRNDYFRVTFDHLWSEQVFYLAAGVVVRA